MTGRRGEKETGKAVPRPSFWLFTRAQGVIVSPGNVTSDGGYIPGRSAGGRRDKTTPRAVPIERAGGGGSLRRRAAHTRETLVGSSETIPPTHHHRKIIHSEFRWETNGSGRSSGKVDGRGGASVGGGWGGGCNRININLVSEDGSRPRDRVDTEGRWLRVIDPPVKCRFSRTVSGIKPKGSSRNGPP